MRRNVVLSICGRQSYAGQDPEVIELVTNGTLEALTADCWELCYDESALTGMEGVTTSFLISPEKIILTRTGKLNSQMVFQVGIPHDSLYQLEFGALMLSVSAQRIDVNLDEAGSGTVDLVYTIEIEQSAAGTIDYHLEVRPQ